MESNEKALEVLNELIKLNYDRVAGFEKAAEGLQSDDTELLTVFTKLAGESREYAAELAGVAKQYGGEPADSTSTSGDLHRAWIDIKTTFTGNDKLAILNECERGEDVIKSAYSDALSPESELTVEIAQHLERQQQAIMEGHDLIKSLRDQLKTDKDNQEQGGDNFTAQPSFEGPAGEYGRAEYSAEPENMEQEEAWQEEHESGEGNSRLMEFFVNELKDLLWAERELVETLPDMANAATSAELKSTFEQHLSETEEHVNRLEQIFGMLGLEVESRKCDAMAGIVDEGDEIIDATEKGTSQRDVGLIFAGQKAEHYEIASYGGMIALAKTLGYYDIAEMFVMTLDEEKTADAKLTEIAENQANYAASREQVEN